MREYTVKSRLKVRDSQVGSQGNVDLYPGGGQQYDVVIDPDKRWNNRDGAGDWQNYFDKTSRKVIITFPPTA